MLEKFNDLSGTILDPTCGAGGLLAAAIIAGADPTKCYGIELDPEITKLCRDRLSKLGVPRSHIKQGNALDPSTYEFSEPRNVEIYLKLDKNSEEKLEVFIEKNKAGNVEAKSFIIDCSNKKSDDDLKKLDAVCLVLSHASKKDIPIVSEKATRDTKIIAVLSKKLLGSQYDAKIVSL